MLLTCLVIAWLIVAPTQFGGRATYVIVDGNSMEPTMYRGDLAVLLRAEAYSVGDIVTYRHPSIGPVIHRIIAADNTNFVLQGDNNSWTDDFRPDSSAIYGRLWFYVPRLGAALDTLRAPVPMMLLALVIGVIAMYPALNIGARRRETAGSSAAPARAMNTGFSGNDLFFATAALAFVSAALAIYAFLQPLTRTVDLNLPYTHVGRFEYRADVPPGIYDGTTAETGDPIFRRVTQTMPVTFGYRFDAEGQHSVTGSCALFVEVADGEGWRRMLPLQSAQPIQANACATAGVLDLNQVQGLIDSFEAQTGVTRMQYTVSLAPEILLNGELEGHALADAFTPRFAFRIDRDRLTPTAEEAALNQSGAIQASEISANTIPLPGFAIEIGTARRIGLSLLMVSISIGLLLWRNVLRIGQDVAGQVRFCYAENLITAQDLDLSGVRIVDLANVDDLGKLAERLGRPIVETPEGFVLLDGPIAYRLKSQVRDEMP